MKSVNVWGIQIQRQNSQPSSQRRVSEVRFTPLIWVFQDENNESKVKLPPYYLIFVSDWAGSDDIIQLDCS